MPVPEPVVALLAGWLAGQGIAVPPAGDLDIRLAAPPAMAALAIEAGLIREVERVGALYDPAADVIYLPEAFDAEDPADRSLLLHELVHAAQDAAGAFDGCADACRDRLDGAAYRQQARWLKAEGEAMLAALVEIQAMFATAPPHMILGRTPTADDLAPPPR
ncbi:MAG: hypothetical protein GVY28_10640 [Alphaproteobacteria bacterium]|jgi:antirestriction protein ArdC|nr:hypothetical protein [Alphaproteobacteria bacterium]